MTEALTPSNAPYKEINPLFQHDPRMDLGLAYGETASNVRIRFNLYKYAIDGEPDMHDRVLDMLELAGDETVVDLGCGAADSLVKLRRDKGHRGDLIGIDIDERLFDLTKLAVEAEGLDPLDLREADGAATGLEDNSADVVLILFAIYHMLPEETLGEAMRILRPGGRIVATTSGLGNKTKHRWLEEITSDYLGVNKPPVFSAACDDRMLEDLMRRQFGDVEHSIHQGTFMRVPEEGVDDIMLSLGTMAHACVPRVTGHEWYRGLEVVAEPRIREEVARTGYWEDSIDRHAFTAKKVAGL